MADSDADLSRGPVLLSFSLATASFALATTFVRFYNHAGIYGRFGADDYTSGAATLVALIGTVFGIIEGTASDPVRALEFNVLGQPWYLLSVTLSKISICLFFMGLLRRARQWRLLLAGLIVLLAVVNLAFALAVYVQCRPLDKVWIPSMVGSCSDPRVQLYLGYAQGAFSVFSWVFLALFPMLMIRDISRAGEPAWPFYATSSLSCISGILVIVRTAQASETSGVSTYTIHFFLASLMANLEQNISLISANLLTFGTLFSPTSSTTTTTTTSTTSTRRRRRRRRHHHHHHKARPRGGTLTSTTTSVSTTSSTSRSRKPSKRAPSRRGPDPSPPIDNNPATTTTTTATTTGAANTTTGTTGVKPRKGGGPPSRSDSARSIVRPDTRSSTATATTAAAAPAGVSPELEGEDIELGQGGAERTGDGAGSRPGSRAGSRMGARAVAVQSGRGSALDRRGAEEEEGYDLGERQLRRLGEEGPDEDEDEDDDHHDDDEYSDSDSDSGEEDGYSTDEGSDIDLEAWPRGIIKTVSVEVVEEVNEEYVAAAAQAAAAAAAGGNAAGGAGGAGGGVVSSTKGVGKNTVTVVPGVVGASQSRPRQGRDSASRVSGGSGIEQDWEAMLRAGPPR